MTRRVAKLPATESAADLQLVGHSSLGGAGDGMQVMRHGDALYVGHQGRSRVGTSILDVSDRASPRLVDQWPALSGSHSHKVQVADDLLLVNQERYPPRQLAEPGSPAEPCTAGMSVYDVKDPFSPRPIGWLGTGGDGVHRIVWTGGRYANASVAPEGHETPVWMVIDLSDPTAPAEVSRWSLDGEAPAGHLWFAHHALIAGDHAYLSYGDAGLIVLDITDVSAPRPVGRLNWGRGFTHTCLPLPGRDLLVVADEAITANCEGGRVFVRVVDVSDPSAPRVISKLPEPVGDFCERGLRFGPHNLHENRLGSYRSERLVFVTYFNAGVRIYDLEDAEHPSEVAHWLPEPPPDQEAPQLNDLYVEEDGLIWATDRIGGGVYALEPTPALAALMAEAAG